jgi:hypothetical protein
MGTIDYQKVKQITGILSGETVDIQSDPGLEPTLKKEPGKWLYAFNQKYLFVEDHVSTIKTDSEAGSLLKQFPTKDLMKVTAAFLSGTEQVLPESLKNLKDVRILAVQDSKALTNYIMMETGVTVDPATFNKADFRTVARRAMDFIADRQKTAAIVTRLRANMKKNIR